MNLQQIFNGFTDWLTNTLNEILAVIMALLPDSPFKDIQLPEAISQYLPYINWIVPFYLIGNILMIWCAAITVYYAYQIILRWIRAIN